MPSTRTLAARHKAGPVTVQRAIRRLVAEGLVETRPGAGVFVVEQALPGRYRVADLGWQTAALGAPPAQLPDLPTALRTQPDQSGSGIALHSGYPAPSLLPEKLVRAALTRAARGAFALGRAPAAGLPELRAAFAAELTSHRSAGSAGGQEAPPTAADVLVVPGSQNALGSIFRSLVGAGRPLLVESPTYWGALQAAARSLVTPVPVPSDHRGPDLAQLERALRQTGARAFYAQPTFANPTGACWSPAVRARVRELLRANGAFLVEDDWARDFGFGAAAAAGETAAGLPAPPPMASNDGDGRVVYLRSLTKSVSPAVRVAAVIARGPARERIKADTQAENMYVSPLLQAAALDVLVHPGWRTHLRSVRRQLLQRRELLVDAVRSQLPAARLTAIPQGGLNLWLQLPEPVESDRLVSDCERAGVLIAPGGEWFPAEPPGAFLRLNFSGPNPERFPEAVSVIAAALAEQGLPVR